MTSPAFKRPRTSLSTPETPALTLKTIKSLPLAEAHKLLLQLSTSVPETAPIIASAISHHIAVEDEKRRNAPSMDFDHYSKSIWKELNITHKRKSGSKQCEAAFDIITDIESAVKAMLAGCDRSDRYHTRLSALETMRKIGKSAILCEEGEIKKVVKNNGGPYALANGMEKVVRMNKRKEKDRL